MKIKMFGKKRKEKPVIKFELIHPLAVTPVKANTTDFGYDLTVTSLKVEKNEFGELILIYGTGLRSEISPGYAVVVAARSSIFKKSVTLANSIGIIDAGYRGEWYIIFKLTKPLADFEIDQLIKGEVNLNQLGLYNIGERAAQMFIVKEELLPIVAVNKVTDDGDRGGGLGSTGNEQLKLQLNN